jgi:hypothetical protein
MRHGAICFVILLYTMLAATTCCAQAQIAPPSVFNQIFKQSTGQNGYEDLVMAGDLLANNAALKSIRTPGATLTMKRRALADPDLQQALALMRAGLDKQIVAPPDSADPAPPFPHIRLMTNFVALMALLATEQYVLLADGETARAVQCLRDGLRFGYAICSQQSLLSRRIGVEIDGDMIEQTVKHLDQFSEHDCDSLLQLVQEWLDTDHSLAPTLIKERDHLLKEIGQVRNNPDGVLQEMRDELDHEDDPQGTQLLEVATPSVVIQAADEAAELCREQIDAAIADLKLPPWQRQDLQLPPGDTLARKLYRGVAPALNPTLDRYDEDRTRLQLLAVHVALRRYRWQYDRLPDRLDSLRLESLTIDPFTGNPLVYRRNGNDYELYSVGPLAYDNTGTRIPDKHTLITLPR